MLATFDLEPYKDGFLLLGPDPQNENRPVRPIQQEKMFEAFTEYITGAVLLGVTAPQIKECADKYGFTNYKMVETFEEAVYTARDLCEPNGTVLLSPACASWGMFKNFEERGRIFKEIVHNMK